MAFTLLQPAKHPELQEGDNNCSGAYHVANGVSYALVQIWEPERAVPMWTWNGVEWIEVNEASPLVDVNVWGWPLVYDPQNAKLVGWGSHDVTNGDFLDDVRVFGSDWTRTTPAGTHDVDKPFMRSHHGMAYVGGGKVVMFGGWRGGSFNGAEGLQNDTWVLDVATATWTKKSPASPPSARLGSDTLAMCWEGTGDTAILFGGREWSGSSLDELADTWRYDLSADTWTLLTPTTSPPAESQYAKMCRDPVSGDILLLLSATSNVVELWRWDGSDWSQVAFTANTIRDEYDNQENVVHLWAFDETRGVAVKACGNITAGKVYEFEPVAETWSDETPLQTPRRGSGYAMCHDEARDEIVAVGFYNPGRESTSDRAIETWTWKPGDGWTKKNPATVPAVSADGDGGMSLTYDPIRGEVVMFGGWLDTNDNASVNTTYTWNGTNWTLKSPATSPSARAGHGAAWDAVRGAVVIFGGSTGAAYLNDVWQWNGTTWSQITTSGGPPSARDGMGFAYDVARDVLVMHGGVGGGPIQGDTWELDGTTWAQITTPTAPGGRNRPVMTYDTAHEVIVATCGYAGGTGGFDVPPYKHQGSLNDVWVYDGVDWTRDDAVPTRPPFRQWAAGCWHSGLERTLIFAGHGASGENFDGYYNTYEYYADLWAYEPAPGGPPPPIPIPEPAGTPNVSASEIDDLWWAVEDPGGFADGGFRRPLRIDQASPIVAFTDQIIEDGGDVLYQGRVEPIERQSDAEGMWARYGLSGWQRHAIDDEMYYGKLQQKLFDAIGAAGVGPGDYVDSIVRNPDRMAATGEDTIVVSWTAPPGTGTPLVPAGASYQEDIQLDPLAPGAEIGRISLAFNCSKVLANCFFQIIAYAPVGSYAAPVVIYEQEHNSTATRTVSLFHEDNAPLAGSVIPEGTWRLIVRPFHFKANLNTVPEPGATVKMWRWVYSGTEQMHTALPLRASDVVRSVINLAAPGLDEAAISPTPQLIDGLVYPEPTQPATVFNEMLYFVHADPLSDAADWTWGVFEKQANGLYRFEFRPRPQTVRYYCSGVEITNLVTDYGNLRNRVRVKFTDVLGRTQTIFREQVVPELAAINLTRTAYLDAGQLKGQSLSSNIANANLIGDTLLRQTRKPLRGGQIRIVGTGLSTPGAQGGQVYDALTDAPVPFWKVKAGELIEITDTATGEAESSVWRIRRGEYHLGMNMHAILTVGQGSWRLDALLARLQEKAG